MSADTAGPTCKASAEIVSPLECSHDWVAADASEDVLCVKCGLCKRTRAEVVPQPPQEGWRSINTCPLGQKVLLLGRGWRHCWVGYKNGPDMECWLDGFHNPEAGWQAHASWWMPLPTPPASAEGSIPSHTKP